MEKSFLSTITRKEVLSLGALLLAAPVLRGIKHIFMMNPMLPAHLSLFAPVLLNMIGTSAGIAIIGRSIGGASVRTPSIVMKALIGIVICEANMIFSLLSFFFLREKAELLGKVAPNQITLREIQAGWALFASGLVCGMCGLIASLGSAIVNSASSIAIASNSKIFSKLVSLQLIVGGVGALGLIVSLFFLRLCPDSTPNNS